MILNHEEILGRKNPVVIKNSIPKNFTQASYNLCIGKILNAKGRESDKLVLPPQGIVNIISKEFIELPDDVVAYATVKNGMSRKGLLAINIGLIDPGYKGNVASHLINFGREEIEIDSNQQFLRLTFHQITIPAENKSLSELKMYQYTEKSYMRRQKEEVRAYIGERFLSMERTLASMRSSVAQRIRNELLMYAAILGVLVAGVSFGVSVWDWDQDEEKVGENQEVLKEIRSLREQVESNKNVYTEKFQELQKQVNQNQQEKEEDENEKPNK